VWEVDSFVASYNRRAAEPRVVKQSSFRYVGAFDLLLVGLLAAAFGPRVLLATPVALAMTAAGVLLFVGGSVAALSLGPVTVSWRQLLGAGYLLFAAVVPSLYVGDLLAGTATAEELFLFLASSLGSVALVVMGVEVARDGDHFSVTPTVGTE
jgi:hypothetical protein